jgi:hypothetical protein
VVGAGKGVMIDDDFLVGLGLCFVSVELGTAMLWNS